MRNRVRLFEKGQGIVEYILITAFVAITATAMFKIFRVDIQKAYEKAGQSLVESVSPGDGSSIE